MRQYHALFLLALLSCCVGKGAATFSLEFGFVMQGLTSAYEFVCAFPILDFIFCGYQAPLGDKNCNGQPCWLETTDAKISPWDWLFPAYPLRHVVCMAFDEGSGKAYMIGGAFGNYRVNIYDPVERSWTYGSQPPVTLHHIQCIAFEGKIFIVSGYTSKY